MSAAKSDQSPNFEQSMAQLESIVSRMEGGELELEQALQEFEQGIGLVKQCRQALSSANQKVEILLKQQGELTVEPFADDDQPA